MKQVWYKGTVIEGKKEGRLIGFPTVNLATNILPKTVVHGIYGCVVKINGALYPGVLFYGPRLVKNETEPVLEIHILDFSNDLYGKEIAFCLTSYIRAVKNFTSMEDLSREIIRDIKKTRNMLS